MTISSLEDLLRSMSMILEEQYNAEHAKPPKHTKWYDQHTTSNHHRDGANTRHRPQQREQNLTSATEPTMILKYQTRI